MARRNPRDDDDFDDEDDYLPRRRRDDPVRRGLPPALIAGLGVGAVAVVVLVVLLFSKRSAERDRALAAEAETRVAADRAKGLIDVQNRPKPPDLAPPRLIGANWPQLIGKWSRPIKGKDDTGYPHTFEFRADRTVTMIQQTSDLQPRTQAATVEVRFDEGETIGLTLHVPMGTYSYTFQLKGDGTLVIQNRGGDLVFTRVK